MSKKSPSSKRNKRARRGKKEREADQRRRESDALDATTREQRFVANLVNRARGHNPGYW